MCDCCSPVSEELEGVSWFGVEVDTMDLSGSLPTNPKTTNRIVQLEERVAEYEAARLELEASVRALEYRLRLLDDKDTPNRDTGESWD
jgi:hypothetical protein